MSTKSRPVVLVFEGTGCLSDGPVPSQVLDNVDELFERDELSAAPDPGWPDCFNSGVFVFQPSLQTHASLRAHALQHGSFDGNSHPRVKDSYYRPFVLLLRTKSEIFREQAGKKTPRPYDGSVSNVWPV